MRTCIIEGCSGKSRTKGLCNKHALRLRLTGTTDPGRKAHAPMEERLWRKVVKDTETGCWNYPVKKGYGRIQVGGKGSPYLSAHRISYESHFGAIPEGKIIMHKCDNMRCVNPEHLEVGTYAQNTADMINKGRQRVVAPLGVKNGKAVLNEEKVRIIRANPDMSHAELGRVLGVATSTIRGVRSGRCWSHVT